MRATLSNGLPVNYLEGRDTITGARVTSCTGAVNGTYFHLGVPETGPEAVRRLRSAAEAFVYSKHKS